MMEVARRSWREGLFAAASLLLAVLGRNASAPQPRLQDMLTFFACMIPSELSMHFLVLQVLLLMRCLPRLLRRNLRGIASRVDALEERSTEGGDLQAKTTAFVQRKVDTLKIAASEVLRLFQSSGEGERKARVALLLAGFAMGLYGAKCFSTMTWHNLSSFLRYRSALRRANVPHRSPSGGILGWIGGICATAAAVTVPLPFFLYRGIVAKKKNVFAVVPKRTVLKRSQLRIARQNGTSASVSLSLTNQELKKLKLDIFYHPDKLLPNAPVFLYIHGGGWITGDRRWHSMPLLFQLAHAGWLVVTTNYRLAPRVRAYPEQLIDCKRALRWVKQNASRYGASRDFVVVGGESAGGHLATLLTLTCNEPKYQPGFEAFDTSVQGCINLYGVMDITDSNGVYRSRDPAGMFKHHIEKRVMLRSMHKHQDTYKRASPYWKVQALSHPFPPIMTVHGTIDTLVPFGDAKHFWAALQDARKAQGHKMEVEDVFVTLPNAHHAFNFFVSPRSLALGDAVIRFVTHLHETTKPKRYGPGQM